MYGNILSDMNATDPSEESDIRLFMSTASVVRDMIEIIERHGQWREREVLGLVSNSANSTTSFEAVLALARW